MTPSDFSGMAASRFQTGGQIERQCAVRKDGPRAISSNIEHCAELGPKSRGEPAFPRVVNLATPHVHDNREASIFPPLPAARARISAGATTAACERRYRRAFCTAWARPNAGPSRQSGSLGYRGKIGDASRCAGWPSNNESGKPKVKPARISFTGCPSVSA